MSTLTTGLGSEAAQWLDSAANGVLKVEPLPRQASKRYYYRVHTEASVYVFMDASLELQTARDFVTQQVSFQQLGFRVPKIAVSDLEQGYLLIEDFGSARLLEQLQDNPDAADYWYKQAMSLIHCLHKAPVTGDTQAKLTDSTWLIKESMRCVRDFLPTLPERIRVAVSVPALEKGIQALADYLDRMPKYLAHADFHAANLMCLSDDTLGVLDFQAPFIAPAPYDLVSLLKDCYITWPRAQVEQWVKHFYDSSEVLVKDFQSFDVFLEAFDAMGLQRHLKCVGLFCHLANMGQTAYAEHLVPVMEYIAEVASLYPRWEVFTTMVAQGFLCYR